MNPLSNLDYYRILGVSHDAEDVVVRAAYRALVQRYHPDKVDPKDRAKAQERIQAIQEAYRVLSDPPKRLEFDQTYRPSPSGKGAKGYSVWAELDPSFINPLDTQSWDALLHFHPMLTERFSRLAQTDPQMAQEYKSFLVELVAERVMAKVVKRVSKEADLKPADMTPDPKPVLRRLRVKT